MQGDASCCSIKHPSKDLLPELPQTFALIQFLNGNGFTQYILRDVRGRKDRVDAVHDALRTMPEFLNVSSLCKCNIIIDEILQHEAELLLVLQ